MQALQAHNVHKLHRTAGTVIGRQAINLARVEVERRDEPCGDAIVAFKQAK